MLTIRYCPLDPTANLKQTAFLLDFRLEVLYGGAAGGGKSSGLLMSALQFVDVPGYSALLLRRTFPELNAAPNGLLYQATEWFRGQGPRWDSRGMRFEFPTEDRRRPSFLTFGYLETTRDRDRYEGQEYQFIGIDELTGFNEADYRFLFSRLRRPVDPEQAISRVPLRMRAGTNPGKRGHAWVKRTFITPGPTSERGFIAARLEDNPFLDVESYSAALARQEPLLWRQLRHGDWDMREPGTFFDRTAWDIVEPSALVRSATNPSPPRIVALVRYWDMAATEQMGGNDPDWTAGCKAGIDERGEVWIFDVTRLRGRPAAVEDAMRERARADGLACEIVIEEEGGASGKIAVDHLIRGTLRGYAARGDRPKGAKDERAKPLAAAQQRGLVHLVEGPWIEDFLDETDDFPDGSHDDQVDAASGAFLALVGALPDEQDVVVSYEQPVSISPY